MSVMSDGFFAALGQPDEETAPHFPVTDEVAQLQWESVIAELKGGRFLDRFLWMLTPGLERLDACLRAWPFLVRPSQDRVIIGRNAYGAIAFVDGINAGRSSVSIVDPLTLRCGPVNDLVGYFARSLRDGPGRFLDHGVYDAWLRKSKLYLEDNLALAIKMPLPLDGKMEVDNFQVEDIFDYYRTTAPAYEKAVAAMKK
jgi:hypothetical protein